MTWRSKQNFNWNCLHKCSSSMDNYKSTNDWRFAQMVKTPKDKDIVKHAQSKIVLHHYWWCPTRAKGIVMDAQPCVNFMWHLFDGLWLIIWILFMFMIFAYSTNALIIFIVYACIGLLGPQIMSLFSFVVGMS